MSAIAGIYQRDSSPARSDTIAAISRRLAGIGPDAEQFGASGPVAMAHRSFATQQDLLTESLLAASDGTLLAFDGRLDNRLEIKRALDVPPNCVHDDPQLMLAVYRAQGLQGLAKCVGDFAFALWEPTPRQLLLCCDGLGRRPLYYRVTRETVLWASSVRALVAGAGLSTNIDHEHIADFFCNLTSERSAFAGVTRLLGGHALVAGPDRAEIVRYWSFDPARSIRYRDDREYERHFRELFQEAVACRIATDGPTFAELSGGLDSSAVTCVASRLVDHDSVAHSALRAVSYVYDRSHSSDERPFIQVVERFLGKSSLKVLESEHQFITPVPTSVRPDWPTNGLCMLAQNDRVGAEMQFAGSRVILSGLGGDQVFWSQPNVAVLLADFVVDRRFGAMLREAIRWSRFLKLPVTQLLTEAWGIARCKQYRDNVGVARWLDPRFLARSDFRTRRRRLSPEATAFRLPTHALQAQAILSAMRPYALEPCLTQGYVDRRYPFLDRRIAEFALAIPVDQKVRLGESRSILRRALKGLVPDVVLQRRTKAGPSEAFMRALIRERRGVTKLLHNARVCEHGIVDRTALHAAINRATHGDASDQTSLIRTLSLELWLRTLDERSPAAEVTAPPGWRERHRLENSHGSEGQEQHGRTTRSVRTA